MTDKQSKAMTKLISAQLRSFNSRTPTRHDLEQQPPKPRDRVPLNPEQRRIVTDMSPEMDQDMIRQFYMIKKGGGGRAKHLDKKYSLMKLNTERKHKLGRDKNKRKTKKKYNKPPLYRSE